MKDDITTNNNLYVVFHGCNVVIHNCNFAAIWSLSITYITYIGWGGVPGVPGVQGMRPVDGNWMNWAMQQQQHDQAVRYLFVYMVVCLPVYLFISSLMVYYLSYWIRILTNIVL